MDNQDKVELASGNAFIEWFNEKNGTNYSFKERAGEAPDLVYSDGAKELRIEHTGAYYDSRHACFIWGGVRNPNESRSEPWFGVNSDRILANEVKNRIEEKSKNDYGKNCILLVEIPPGVTSAEELEGMLLPVPEYPGSERFTGIYVAGRFPNIDEYIGGYKVITIHPTSGVVPK